jgi:hypothetical protein
VKIEKLESQIQSDFTFAKESLKIPNTTTYGRSK